MKSINSGSLPRFLWDVLLLPCVKNGPSRTPAVHRRGRCWAGPTQALDLGLSGSWGGQPASSPAPTSGRVHQHCPCELTQCHSWQGAGLVLPSSPILLPPDLLCCPGGGRTLRPLPFSCPLFCFEPTEYSYFCLLDYWPIFYKNFIISSSFILKSFFNFIFMYVSVFLHICLYTACVLSAEGGQKKVPGTGVLAGPQQLCKNRLGTEPRSFAGTASTLNVWACL